MLLIWLVPRRGIFQEGSWEGPWEGPKWMSNSKNSKGPSNFVAKASNLHQRLMTGRPLHLFYPIRTPPATSWRSYFENSNRYHRSWPRQKDLPALPRVAVEPRVQRWRLSTSTNRCEFLEAGRDWPIVLPTYSQIDIPIMDLKMWWLEGYFRHMVANLVRHCYLASGTTPNWQTSNVLCENDPRMLPCRIAKMRKES